MYTLDKCPFCKGKDLEMKNEFIAVAGYVGKAWWVECMRCECAGPIGKTEESAAKLWNDRGSDENE